MATEMTFDQVKACLGDQVLENWLLRQETDRLRVLLAEREAELKALTEVFEVSPAVSGETVEPTSLPGRKRA